MVEYVVCVCMQLSIVENSCICLDKGTYVCMLLKKLIMDLKSWIQMHIMIENVCINSDMIKNTFLWCKLHTALCSFVDCYIILHWTVAHNCKLVHMVTHCFKMPVWLDMVEQGFVLLQVAAYVQISCNMSEYHFISLCWITYGCTYISKWMHGVNLILV